MLKFLSIKKVRFAIGMFFFGFITNFVWNPIGTIINLNIERAAEAQGWDQILSQCLNGELDCERGITYLLDGILAFASYITGPFGLGVGAGALIFTFWDIIVRNFYPKSPLRINFNRDSCEVLEKSNGQCSAFRVVVTNTGSKSVEGVSVIIDDISMIGNTITFSGDKDQKGDPTGFKMYSGLPLCVTQDWTATMAVPFEKPDYEATIHPDRTVYFDLVRGCVKPGNHRVQHAAYQRNSLADNPRYNHTTVEQKPSGVIPPGDYEFTLSVINKKFPPIRKQFRLYATDKRVELSEVS